MLPNSARALLPFGSASLVDYHPSADVAAAEVQR